MKFFLVAHFKTSRTNIHLNTFYYVIKGVVSQLQRPFWWHYLEKLQRLQLGFLRIIRNP